MNQQEADLAKKGRDVYAITRQEKPGKWVIRNVNSVKEGSYSASVKEIIDSLFSLVRYTTKFYHFFHTRESHSGSHLPLARIFWQKEKV